MICMNYSSYIVLYLMQNKYNIVEHKQYFYSITQYFDYNIKKK